jgi:hypothetical protein
MSTYRRGLLALAAVVGLHIVPASATPVTFTLDQGAFTGNFGTVTLTQDGTNRVKVEVDLAANVGFVDTGAGDPLLFDIAGNPAITITNLTAGFAIGNEASGHSIHTGGAGNFEYDILCTACGNGGSHPDLGPLVFDVTAPGLTPNSFVSDGTAYFAADICRDVLSNHQCTGVAGTGVEYANVAADPPPSVPEPATPLIFGAGLLGLGILRRRTA